MARYLGPAENGIRLELGRYGEVTLSLMGQYQIPNVSLAVIGAGNMHGRLAGIPHGSPEYVERIRGALADVHWPGRLQKLQDAPAVYVDGAINRESAQLLVDSIRDHLTEPVISILAVPDDKDYDGVFQALGAISNEIILTETPRNPRLHFLEPSAALAAASKYNPHVSHVPGLQSAVEQARSRAGQHGTILIVGTQSIIADAMELWGYSFEVL